MTTYGSVCSGIEAASVAWDIFGFKPAWFAEIDPAASAVLAHRYPKVVNLGDMTKIAQYVRMGLVEAPDILVGGTPCQAFSVAGVRAGLADPRGQLTLAYADLANAIDEQRPGNECVIKWENVPGVLSDKTNAFGCFLALLAGESDALIPTGGKWPNAGCVFGPQRAIAWRVIDAQYFGVAQRRRRVYLVASARKGFDPAKLLFESDGLRRDIAPRREAREEISGTLGARASSGGFGTGFECAGGLQPVFAVSNPEGAKGLPFLTASNIGKTVNNQTPLLYTASVCPTLRAGGNTTGGDRPPGTDVDTCESLIAFSCKDYGGDALVGIAPTMRAMGHSDSHQNGGGQLAVLTAEGTRTGQPGPNLGRRTDDAIAFEPRYLVRRLTPVECERLQGFPDNWTLVPYRDKLMADGPRYKALGNSMAVPCMRWLAARLLVTHPEFLTIAN